MIPKLIRYYKTKGTPFYYSCVGCGTDTWDRGKIVGNDAGTICIECVNQQREGKIAFILVKD